ncbi:MAG: beta-lactamase family protein [Rhodobacteraceae bacterium]|nr:beta-lactamase family protein [Paracoccaceae bacterium]
MTGFSQTRLDRIKTWMQRYVDEQKFPGSSVLISQKGQEVFYHDCGQRDIAASQPWTRDTVVRIYSMTKPVTSVALMMLVEEGLVHLDAPLGQILPEFAEMTAVVPGATRLDQTEPAPSPTLHQLLTHTSGLTYGFNLGLVQTAMAEADLNFGPSEGTLEDICQRLATYPLVFQPGAGWEYSVGIDVIGRVVEVLSDQTLDTFFQERIFDPLGMTDTGFAVKDGQADRFAALYTPLAGNAMDLNAETKGSDPLREIDRAEGSPYLAPTTFSGGGGLIGTIDDYAKFAEMLRQGGALNGQRLLSRHTVEFMCRNHLAGDIASMGPSSFAEQPMDGVGFGIGGAVVLDPARARCAGSVGDFSWGGMASTFFWVDPLNDVSVVFFTQLSPSSSYPNRAELKALVHGAME